MAALPNLLAPKGQAEVRILLVSDDPANLIDLRSALNDSSIEIVAVHTAEAALNSIKAADFAVILIDLSIVSGIGWEFADHIRKRTRSRSTPVILLAKRDFEPSKVEEAYTFGAVDFLVKPFLPCAIRAKIMAFAELFRERRETAREAEQLRLLVQGTTDYAIFMLDPAGYVATWNAGAQRLKGYEATEIIGQHFSKFYPREAIELRWPEHELKMAEKVGRFEDEGWRLRKDGTRFWANVVLTALRDEQGTLCGYSKVTRDLTSRKIAQESLRKSEERFRLLVEGVKDYAIFQLDPDGIIVSWNAGAERIKGYSASDIMGRHFSKFYPQEAIDSGWPAHELAVAKAEGRCEDEGWRIKKDGSRIWANVVITALRTDDGKLVGFSKITRDMTERRAAEENARRLVVESTARRVAEQNARIIEEQRLQLSDAANRKDEFLATLSHELRNPLAPMRNALMLMRMATEPEIQEKARDVMDRQLAQMARLVDDLLDLSRISRGAIELRRETVSLQAIIDSAVETSRPLIERMGHVFKVALPQHQISVNGDLSRLSQVFSNLLNNAAKYSDPNGRIDLTARQENGNLVVGIRDQGVGIAADQLPRIFEMFIQVDNTIERSQGGLGIGLTLVKKLVELHDGKIEARSDGINSGSEFIVTLPLSQSSESDQPSIAGVKEQSHSRRILIVDDNRDNAQCLALLLNTMGNETRTAFDGKEGVEVAEAFRPDLILLDIGLPKMNGYEACKSIRQRSWIRRPVLIAITGWGQDEDRRRSHEAGFDHHIVKPVDPRVLFQLIAGL